MVEQLKVEAKSKILKSKVKKTSGAPWWKVAADSAI